MTEDKSSRKRKSVKRGDDLVQAALRLAEEMSDSVEDLETSVHPVAVSTGIPLSLINDVKLKYLPHV